MKKIIIISLIIFSCKKEANYKLRVFTQTRDNIVYIENDLGTKFSGSKDIPIDKNINLISTKDSAEFWVYENDKNVFSSQGKCRAIWKKNNTWEVFY